jgi:signal transduction histidine kinase/CheY-like chemotaxis protein
MALDNTAGDAVRRDAMASAPQAELDERRLQVVSEQASGLRWQIALTVFVIAVITWRAVPWPVVLAWLAAVLAAREWRAAALARWTADRATPIAHRLRATVWSNVLIGTANGSAAAFMWWLDPTLDAVLTMILVSWGAGAVSTSSTVMPAFLAYAGLLFVPTAAAWALGGTWLGVGVAALVLMFFGVQLRFARRNLETFEESFRIRLENDALARRLEAEQAALALARDAAVKANLEKSRFLAAASHDLRQPLQAVTLNSGELARRPLDPASLSIAREIASSVDQLRTMLDALLEASKLDAGVVLPQPRTFEVARLVDGLVDTFRAAAAARGETLRAQSPPQAGVHTDPALLRRMLSNLVDNAIKFSPAGTAVDVDVTADDASVTVTVRDAGPGIAPQDHARIFEDLVQLPAAAGTAPAGHGLGLGIVRRLGDLLGVAASLDSARGQGAAFSLTLPRARAVDDAAPAAVDAARLSGCRVLVLDDDSMVRGAYVNALGGMGCRVWSAATIGEAEARAAQCAPQAAVIDCSLGDGEDGFAALERLKRQHPGLAAVMVSAHTDAATSAQARGHAIALLRKPVDAATLSSALVTALREHDA